MTSLLINGSARALTNLQKNMLWSCLNNKAFTSACAASQSHLLNSCQTPANTLKLNVALQYSATTFNPKNQFASILFGSNVKMNRFYSTNKEATEKAEKTTKGQEETKNEGEDRKEPPKKQSKFKQLYSQYGPIFLVVHLTTVVLWIYSFFLISKQGYDITQLLNVFHAINLMSKETLDSIHNRIDNYQPSSGWVTGENIKHFATAYMVYKVIAPFRYVVSIAICRSLVNALRARGFLKR